MSFVTRQLSGWRTATCLVVFLALGLWFLAAATGPAAPGHTSRIAGSAGVYVRLPARWHFFPAGVAPRSMPYGDPLIRIVVASTPIRSDQQGCKAETFRFSRGGVGLMVVEWLHPQNRSAWPKRPRRFTAKSLPVEPGHAVECWPGRGGSTVFRDHGRYLGAYLLLGRGTDLSAAARARAVLDTLTVALKH
jgi:hypothetical protein